MPIHPSSSIARTRARIRSTSGSRDILSPAARTASAVALPGVGEGGERASGESRHLQGADDPTRVPGSIRAAAAGSMDARRRTAVRGQAPWPGAPVRNECRDRFPGTPAHPRSRGGWPDPPTKSASRPRSPVWCTTSRAASWKRARPRTPPRLANMTGTRSAPDTGRADVHPAIHEHRIDRDDLRPQGLRQRERGRSCRPRSAPDEREPRPSGHAGRPQDGHGLRRRHQLAGRVIRGAG